MFKRKKQRELRQARSTRQPMRQTNSAFRLNNPVISRSQKEMAERQQSVTQRQFERKKAKTRSRQKRRVLIVTALIGLLLLFIRMIITASNITTDDFIHLTDEQKQAYQKSLNEAYQNNSVARQAWLLDKSATTKDFLAEHPEVASAQLTTSNPVRASLEAKLTFRVPVFKWRGASKTEQFVDNHGVLFSLNLDPRVDLSKLINIEDESGTVLDQGTSVLTDRLMQFAGGLHLKLPPLYGPQATIGRVVVPAATREVQAQIAGQPYLIRFSSERDLDEQIGELDKLLNYMRSKNITPSVYIDLRVAGKAFYK